MAIDIEALAAFPNLPMHQSWVRAGKADSEPWGGQEAGMLRPRFVIATALVPFLRNVTPKAPPPDAH